MSSTPSPKSGLHYEDTVVMKAPALPEDLDSDVHAVGEVTRLEYDDDEKTDVYKRMPYVVAEDQGVDPALVLGSIQSQAQHVMGDDFYLDELEELPADCLMDDPDDQ